MSNFKKKRLIKRVNEALGIELYGWQALYIFMELPNGMHLSCPERFRGVTTSQILRVLLSPTYEGLNVVLQPCSIHNKKLTPGADTYYIDLYGDDAVSLFKQEAFIKECDRIKNILNDAGIKTNDVVCSLSRKKRLA